MMVVFATAVSEEARVVQKEGGLIHHLVRNEEDAVELAKFIANDEGKPVRIFSLRETHYFEPTFKGKTGY